MCGPSEKKLWFTTLFHNIMKLKLLEGNPVLITSIRVGIRVYNLSFCPHHCVIMPSARAIIPAVRRFTQISLCLMISETLLAPGPFVSSTGPRLPVSTMFNSFSVSRYAHGLFYPESHWALPSDGARDQLRPVQVKHRFIVFIFVWCLSVSYEIVVCVEV